MTRKDSAPEFDPRHRILGAIVVTGLAVVFIPMILSEAPKPAGPGAQRMAIEETLPEPATRVVVTPVAPPEARSDPVASAAGAEPPPAAAPEPAPPKPPAAAAAAPPAAPESGWVVQVGTFANAANARRLEQQLRAGGESILTERVRLDGGEAVRVRVGPFARREQALEARARIRKEVGLQGDVQSYP